MKILLDTGQTIGLVVYILIGVFILAIVIGSIVGAASRKKSYKEESEANDRIDQIIKTNPDELFNLDVRYYNNRQKIMRDLTYSVNWSIYKKMLLLKEKGWIGYKHSDVYHESSVCFDPQTRMDVGGLISDSFIKCFYSEKDKNNRTTKRTLTNTEEAIYCYVFFYVFAEDPYDNKSSFGSIKYHRGINELISSLGVNLSRIEMQKNDPIFEKIIKKVYEMLPAEWLIKTRNNEYVCYKELFEFLEY